jgi:hypothetical protein
MYFLQYAYFAIWLNCLYIDSVEFKQTIKSLKSSGTGYRTITSLETNIQANSNNVFTKLCDFKTWNEWLSPNSKFIANDSTVTKYSQADQSCDEVFGLFESSRIKWKVKEIKSPNMLKVCSNSSEGTIGWNELELEFILSPISLSETNLIWVYSWTVNNPIVAIIEEKFVRNGMIDDNKVALNKFLKLCVKT